MGGSAAESPTPPDGQWAPGGLRASDAERDEVATRLRDEFVAGRLSHDTFLYRINAVLAAKRSAELPPLLGDLPSQRPAQPASRSRPAAIVAAGGRSLAGWFRGAWSKVADPASFGRPDHGAGPRTAVPQARVASRVVTMGWQAAADITRPRPLEFPRGSADRFSIGRDANCDLAIADMTVSRRHATLERTQDGWLLTDLESTNGTRVNGWRVHGRVKVTSGDLVSFGNAEYSLSPVEPG
ncbi:MAG: DUF1707 and FHA domain-containing protein [Trebonia sp.]|jgi:hypothetical protein